MSDHYHTGTDAEGYETIVAPGKRVLLTQCDYGLLADDVIHELNRLAARLADLEQANAVLRAEAEANGRPLPVIRSEREAEAHLRHVLDALPIAPPYDRMTDGGEAEKAARAWLEEAKREEGAPE